MPLNRLTAPTTPLAEKYIEREVLALQKLNIFVWQMTQTGEKSARWQACVATTTYLYTTLNRYDFTAHNPATRDLQQKLCREITALQDAVARGMPRQSEWELSQAEATTARECGLEPPVPNPATAWSHEP